MFKCDYYMAKLLLRNTAFFIYSLFRILALFLLIAAFSDGHRCPTAEDMAPCKCLSDSTGNVVHCLNILNSEELIPSMQTLANSSTKVDILKIKDSCLMYLPEDLFQNTQIEWVDFEDSEILSLSETDTAFNGLENTLEILRATYVITSSGWDFDQLRNLRKLSTIFLFGTILGEIDNSFPHLPNLQRLTIDYAEISYISDEAFKNLPNLSYFDMEYNDITEMKMSMLPNPANKLATINLRHNKLSNLPKDFFDNMPSLSQVLLDKNKFSTLTEMPFSVAFGKISELSMSENPFRCDCRMRWLLKVRLPSVFRGECSTPTTLFGKSIKNLDFKSLWC